MKNGQDGIKELDHALKRIRFLEEEIKKDPLTGLYNRIYTETLINEVLENGAGIRIWTFLMFDLDNFKLVNDNFGHLAGDALLKYFAEILQEVFTKDSIIGRVGGDEFVILTADTADLREKVETVEARFRKVVAGETRLESVSCSAGVSYFNEGSSNFQRLYKAADEDLYRTKRQKKNE